MRSRGYHLLTSVQRMSSGTRWCKESWKLMASMMSETDQDPGAVLEVEVSRSVDPLDEEPDERVVTDWLKKTYSQLGRQRSEVSVRVVSTQEIANLNQTYRGNPS